VEVHPADAERLGLADGALARVSTPQGESLFRVGVTDTQREGELFTPIHWTDVTSTGGRTGLLARPIADPHSGQPGFKRAPAAIAAIETRWRGFLLLRGETAAQPECLWATRVAVPMGSLWELAGNSDVEKLLRLLPPGERMEAVDAGRGTRRVAVVAKGQLKAALFLTETGELPPRDWLIAQLSAPAVAPTLLAGRAPGVLADRGPIICACFDVGLNSILQHIRSERPADVAAIGAALKAGTNCGSCRPALARILEKEGATHAA
jgi:assimilatory nitrate reductase catalytic subunit